MNRNALGRVPNLHTGDILATRADGINFLAWLIRWKTQGPWSHIALGYSGATVCEAMPKGVTLNPVSNYLTQWWVQLRWHTHLSHETTSNLALAMEKRIGRKYDWKALFGFSLFVGRDINNKEKYFCSELACDVYREAGLKLVSRRSSGLVPPQDVVECPMLDVIDWQWPKNLMHWIDEEPSASHPLNRDPNDHTKFDHE